MIPTAVESARLIAERELSAEELVRSCLERIEEREPEVRAWTFLDPERALAEARGRDGSEDRGPLHGVPVGVKDLFDTVDAPTEYGSPIYHGHRPQADATAVRRLREAGAVVLGKTVTTEFAFFHPGPTRNPHDPTRTPGGSSSGSAAGVADGMMALAIGTQTAGSIIRPAAFCGVFGYKPSFGPVSRAGVKPLAPSLDTVGGFARDPSDLALLCRVLAGPDPADAATDGRPVPSFVPDAHSPRVALVRSPEWPAADEASRDAVMEAARAAEAQGATVEELELPQPFAEAVAAQVVLMEAECSESLRWEYEERGDLMSDRLRSIIANARARTPEQRERARDVRATCEALLPGVFARHDVLLTPSAPGEAPRGLDGTGDPIFCRTWTMLGCPACSVPGLHGPSGMPVGVQLVGRPGADAIVLGASAWLAALLR
jgi:Asp-tRNA(Asn)/Glu-tRNA(Gln) amidotransferase A subunit family amidase